MAVWQIEFIRFDGSVGRSNRMVKRQAEQVRERLDRAKLPISGLRKYNKIRLISV